MRTILLFGAMVTLVVTGGMGIISLHRTNAALRAQVNEKQGLHEKRAVKPVQSAFVIAPRADGGGAADAVMNEAHARLMQLRAEVASWEKKAAEQYTANPEEADAPSTNRDPEKGMTKLEYMQNVGQGTPAAALQTFFWAILKGEDQVIARTIAWDEAVRPQVQALIDRLPAESRSRYSTPEQLWGLVISKYALDVSAIYIAATVPGDAANVLLTVKGLTGRDEHVPMHLGADGWQLWVGEAHLRMITNELIGETGSQETSIPR